MAQPPAVPTAMAALQNEPAGVQEHEWLYNYCGWAAGGDETSTVHTGLVAHAREGSSETPESQKPISAGVSKTARPMAKAGQVEKAKASARPPTALGVAYANGSLPSEAHIQRAFPDNA